MPNEKKWKVHGLDKALEAVPAEERSGLAAEIENMFADFDPDNPPGEPVVTLAPGTTACPKCGGDLTDLTLVAAGVGPGMSSPPLLLLDCETCEIGYCQTVTTDVH